MGDYDYHRSYALMYGNLTVPYSPVTDDQRRAWAFRLEQQRQLNELRQLQVDAIYPPWERFSSEEMRDLRFNRLIAADQEENLNADQI